MGTTDFMTFSEGAEVAPAFEAARRAATHEYGHGGYTGTIAEKHDYRIVTRAPLPRYAALRLAERMIHENNRQVIDKYGPAGAIPYANVAATGERVVTPTIELPLDEPPSDPILERLARLHLKLQSGEHVRSITIADRRENLSLTSRRTPGKAVTRYFVIDEFGGLPAWDQGHPTATAARKDLDARLKHPPQNILSTPQSSFLQVVGVTRREDGAGLAEGERKPTKRIVDLKVHIMKHDPITEPQGWLFFGLASI